MKIPYTEARGLIKEADILLFGAHGFPSIGWWIGKYTHSEYSHVGLAHWEDGRLYCLEFREFKGSRMYPISQYILEHPNDMAVFRAVETAIFPVIKFDNFDGKPYLSYIEHKFSTDIAHAITNTAKKLLGRPYSYWTIWQMFKTYIPFVRLRSKIIKNGEPDATDFVCSTLITYAYRINYCDPIPFLRDKETTPGDLARSGLFSYLFSINLDKEDKKVYNKV